MDSGQIDFYQHDTVCSNTCRSTKFDVLLNSTRLPPGSLVHPSPSSLALDPLGGQMPPLTGRSRPALKLLRLSLPHVLRLLRYILPQQYCNVPLIMRRSPYRESRMRTLLTEEHYYYCCISATAHPCVCSFQERVYMMQQRRNTLWRRSSGQEQSGSPAQPGL